jgi:hypothetical protein
MQRHVLSVVLSWALLSGCADAASPGAMQSPAFADLDAASSGPSAGEHCDNYQAEADELRTAAEACQQDEDCAVIGIDAPCLLSFLCPTPLNRTAVDGLRPEASRLSAAYRGCINQCAVASCVYGEGAPAICNPSTHRCEGRPFR